MVPLTKAQLRLDAQSRRNTIHAASDSTAAAALLNHGLPAILALPGNVIGGFWPIRTEPDIRPLLGALASETRQVALPVVTATERPLEFRAWKPGDNLIKGPLGTFSPTNEQPKIRPDIMLVPLLAFDAGRRRLGYGGGFYDRTIAALKSEGRPLVTIGVGYAGLEVLEVPTDPWDQPLDAVLTEQGLMR